MLKAGDRVRVKPGLVEGYIGGVYFNSSMVELCGRETTVRRVRHTASIELDGGEFSWNWSEEMLELISEEKTSMTNVIERFKIACLPEPEKTFRELGITNGDNLLTDEGRILFINYLLEKNKVEFKKEVADKLKEDK